KGAVFKEVMLMNALALQGKIARLPLIFGLHGAETSRSPLSERNPLHWFLDDPPSLFRHYVAYRDVLVRHIRQQGIADVADVDLTRLVDIIHATWLGRSCDTGSFNHVARMLPGAPLPPIVEPRDWPGPRAPAAGDIVHTGGDGRRRYVWR